MINISCFALKVKETYATGRRNRDTRMEKHCLSCYPLPYMEDKVLLIAIRESGESERKAFLREAEIRSLISTLGLNIVYTAHITLKDIRSSTLIGKGQVEAIAEAVRAFEPDEAVIDASITPRQEKNLEEALGIPVSDREAVILSIFFQNARSREARLQIEKAEAEYLRPRLANREARLSQQRGGVRGAKGEGERKIELERRMIDTRIHQLDREIKASEEVRRTQRSSRERSGIFTFALVGYTNAGKSTILNALTGSDALAEDKLFATLDTTTRSMKLPSGQKVLLSDTVGFISELPAGLVKAFSSTLEEALSAEALIIVADASYPDALGCLRETEKTLEELGAREKAKILVINKTDSIYDDISYAALRSSPYMIVETSMKEGKGIQELKNAMEKATDEAFQDIVISSPCSASLISGLYRDGTVKEIEYGDGEVTIKARLRNELIAKYIGSGITELE